MRSTIRSAPTTPMDFSRQLEAFASFGGVNDVTKMQETLTETIVALVEFGTNMHAKEKRKMSSLYKNTIKWFGNRSTGVMNRLIAFDHEIGEFISDRNDLIWRRRSNKRRITDSHRLISEELSKFDANIHRRLIVIRAMIVSMLKSLEHDWNVHKCDLEESSSELYS